eukprot:6781716-Prymnesium_polylepis.1
MMRSCACASIAGSGARNSSGHQQVGLSPLLRHPGQVRYVPSRARVESSHRQYACASWATASSGESG